MNYIQIKNYFNNYLKNNLLELNKLIFILSQDIIQNPIDYIKNNKVKYIQY